MMFSWCDSVPSTVHIRDDIWKDNQVPGEDDLDRFLVSVTGVGYGNDPRSYVIDCTGLLYATGIEHPLPGGQVSRTRYMRFYVRLQPGSVMFGRARECYSAPLYTGTQHPTVAGGTVGMYLYGDSQIGAKLLYNCPAVTGNIAHTTAYYYCLITSVFAQETESC